MSFNIGDIVRVIDDGATYSTYEDLARLLKLKGWYSGRTFRAGTEAVVVDFSPHLTTRTPIVAIQNDIGQVVLIGERGLKFIGGSSISKQDRVIAKIKEIKQRRERLGYVF